MKKRVRAIQPAHESERITVEEAMEGWRRVQARMTALGNGRGNNPSSGKRAAPVVTKKPSSTTTKVAADHDKRSPEP